MLLALAIALCAASGYLIVRIAWPSLAKGTDRLLKWSLAVGFGLGFSSATFFVLRATNLQHFLTIDALCFAFLLGWYFLRGQNGSMGLPQAPDCNLELPPWLHRFLIAAFAVTLAAALYSSVKLAIAHPRGDGWDAFSIWNLHALFLFRGGSYWRDGLSPLIPWSHPDYPLLLPASIAHFWTYLGTDSPAVPAIIGLSFTFSTLGLLYSSLERVRGRTTAMLGLMTLGTTPFFIEQGSSQYADVPLSFFILASIVLLSIFGQYPAHNPRPRGFIVLAGLALGFGAWTKNEGVLVVFATVLASLLVSGHSKLHEPRTKESEAPEWRAIAILLLSAVPVFGLVLWLKHVAPRGDLLQAPAVMLQKFLTPARYWVILKWYSRELFRFGEWWPISATLLFLAVYFIAASREMGPKAASLRIAIWMLILTLAGYFAIYVITPNELYWHLRFSLNRLFLQLWPSAVYLFFSSVFFRFVRNVSK